MGLLERLKRQSSEADRREEERLERERLALSREELKRRQVKVRLRQLKEGSDLAVAQAREALDGTGVHDFLHEMKELIDDAQIRSYERRIYNASVSLDEMDLRVKDKGRAFYGYEFSWAYERKLSNRRGTAEGRYTDVSLRYLLVEADSLGSVSVIGGIGCRRDISGVTDRRMVDQAIEAAFNRPKRRTYTDYSPPPQRYSDGYL